MPVQFCPDCGDLLPLVKTKEIRCECCGKPNENKLLTYSATSTSTDFPSALRQKRSGIQKPVDLEATDTWSTIDQQCPKCGGKEVKYTSLQLRSADEGTTMFYFCPVCEEKWNEDN